HLADSRHARMPALAQEDGLQVLFLDRVIGRPCVRQQGGRQFDASRDGYKEVHEQESQQNTADFQDSARAPPPDLLRVVEVWFSFFHVAWPPPGLGWTFRRRSSIRAMKRYSSIVRCEAKNDETHFLRLFAAPFGGRLPAPLFCAPVSCRGR